ncbi:MAG: thioredoxin family protein [Candidatus Zipacnadales bacterium]
MNPKMYKAMVLLFVAAVLVIGVWWELDNARPRRTALDNDALASVESSAAEQPSPLDEDSTQPDDDEEAGPPNPTGSGEKPTETPEYPAVIDLGMGKCIPCKQMKPILDELKDEYAGRCRIEIIDIGEHPAQADKYGIMLIPTQIFFDKKGKEVYRHEGFMSKADIVAKLKEMGIE